MKIIYLFKETFCLILIFNTVCALSPKPRRSVEKCSSYANADYIYDDPKGSKTCTLPQLNNIVQGSAVEAKEFPHLALIGFPGNDGSPDTFPCMGSLISDRYVLTVAHCAFNRIHGPPTKVRIGDFSKDPSNDGHSQEIDIKEVRVHPDYNIRARTNDIALLELKTPAKLNAYVRPACLYTNKNISHSKGLYAGQGNQDESVSNVKKIKLLKIVQDILPNEICLKAYGKGFTADGGQICTSTTFRRRNGNCQGESGSVLVAASQFPCMYEIFGLAAFGTNCGEEKDPEGYTNVPYHLDWIENIVWPVEEGLSNWSWPGQN